MPIVANAEATEIPWRTGYRRFTLAGKEQGVACSASYSVLEPGAGAPLHRHDALDEVLIVVEGQLDVMIGSERHLVEADHTISIPAGVPHAFVATGPSPARFFAFLPKQGAEAATTYLEGEPPVSADQR
jgi:quercetin dioxygenase-like cupin family protein